MKKALLLFLAFVLVPPAAVPLNAADAAEAVLASLERQWVEKLMQRDPQFFERILHPEFLHTGFDGQQGDRERWHSFYNTGNWKYDSLELSELRVRVYADSAVSSGKLRRRITVAGRTTEGEQRFTHVWSRQGEAWRVVASHVSNLAP